MEAGAPVAQKTKFQVGRLDPILLKRRIIGCGIPSHLLTRGWFAAQIRMINRPVPGEQLENQEINTVKLHHNNLILGLGFHHILLLIGPWAGTVISRYQIY